MIDKLKKKIFWVMELLPLCVLFLVLIVYNASYISFTLSDEKELLDYCTSCVEQRAESMDEYLYRPPDQLAQKRKISTELTKKEKNLLHAVITSYISVIKTDADGNILNQTENCRYLSRSDLAQYTSDHGRVGRTLYSVVTKGSTKYIVLLDTSDWLTDILICICGSLLGLLLAALLFAAVARYLSNKVTRPVEESMVKQNHFISDASHELKTPISVINANIAVLEHEYGENKWMGYIKEEGHKMNQLINELLSLCRIDYDIREKNNTSSSDPFQVYEAIMEAALPFDSAAFDKKVTIATECPEDLRSKGDRQDFQKIMTILTDNAVTHVNAGGEILIAVKQVKNTLHVTVSNTGSVISEQNLPYIFERFYKAKDTSGASKMSGASAGPEAAKTAAKVSAEGTSEGTAGNFGLGLSIAKALCDKNSFTISARSRDNSTCFTVVVPWLQP